MASHSQRKDSSPSRINRLISRLTRTPSRRQEAAIGTGSLRTPPPPGPFELPVTPTSPKHQYMSSMTAESIRKRQKLEQMRNKRQQREELSGTRMGLSPGLFLSPLSTPTKKKSAMANSEQEMLMDEEFFNGCNLNCLLNNVNVEPELPPHPQPLKSPAADMTAEDRDDFTINIPSTTLSPVAIAGNQYQDRYQRRSRTAAAVISPTKNRKNGSVEEQLEAELQKNMELKDELARLHSVVRALSRLMETQQRHTASFQPNNNPLF